LRVRNRLGDPGRDERIILRLIFRKWEVWIWNGSIWLRIGTGSGHLWMRRWTFGFYKMRGICWLSENRLASQERACYMEWVSKYVRVYKLLNYCLFGYFCWLYYRLWSVVVRT
jgi:hypothetical protein